MVIRMKNIVSRNNGGDGFRIDGNVHIEAEDLQAIGNKGDGIRITIPGTTISLTPEDVEKAKEILRSSPESKWPERLKTIKGILAVAEHLPAIIGYVRSLL